MEENKPAPPLGVVLALGKRERAAHLLFLQCTARGPDGVLRVSQVHCCTPGPSPPPPSGHEVSKVGPAEPENANPIFPLIEVAWVLSP